jgi:hypothetical protein
MYASNQKLKKKKKQKFFCNFLDQKLLFIVLMSNELPVQEKRSAHKREHPAPQMKFNNFFLSLWVIFALLDPDCESGSGRRSSDPIVPLKDRLPCGGEIRDEGENHDGGRHQQGDHLPLL